MKKNIIANLVILTTLNIICARYDTGTSININIVSPIDGTWRMGNRYIIFNGNQWIHGVDNIKNYKGTFIYSKTTSGDISFTFTNIINISDYTRWKEFNGKGTDHGKIHNCSFSIDGSYLSITGCSWFGGIWIKQ